MFHISFKLALIYVEAIHKGKYGHSKHNLMATECYLKGGIEA